MRDRECPMLFSNGKGASELATQASALGEFFERLGPHYSQIGMPLHREPDQFGKGR